jgi:hypothetical protein
MFLASVNKPRQLLLTRYIGNVRQGELSRACAELKSLLAELQPGFTALVDLSQLTDMDPECATEVGTFMEAFTRAGIGRVVRVIPDHTKDIGFNILGVFHYPHGLSVVNCESFADAARALEL